MAVLIWKHGKTKTDALTAIQNALKEAGYSGYVKWNGFKAEAKYGLFSAGLHAQGEITDTSVVLEKCGGLAGGVVLNKCREMLQRLFPRGD